MYLGTYEKVSTFSLSADLYKMLPAPLYGSYLPKGPRVKAEEVFLWVLEFADTSRCLLGHNGFIEFLEVAVEAQLAATVENTSQQPSIRCEVQ